VTFDVRRAGAIVAALILLGGYALVFRPLEAAVADRYAELEATRATLEHSLALARRIPALAGERKMLATQLAHLHVRDRRAATVERFLRAVAGVAARDGVTVQTIAANALQVPRPAPRSTQAALFDELPLDLTLRGRYADVIRAVRELNGGDVAARISLASLGNADRRPGTRPQLNAAFHVLLLREGDDTTTPDARSR